MKYSRTILHVDDDPDVTRIVARQLQARHFEITSLNDPRQVLDELRRSQHRLVLLDIDMPHIDGLELLRQIKANHGGTQVIMLTGLVSMDTLLQSYRWGAEFCLFKSVADLHSLLEAIERTFEKIEHWWDALAYLSQENMALRSDGFRSAGFLFR